MSHPSRRPHCSATEQCLHELRFELRDSVTHGTQALGPDSDLKTLEKCSKNKKKHVIPVEIQMRERHNRVVYLLPFPAMSVTHDTSHVYH